MALSERAKFLVIRIDQITERHKLHPVLPRLPVYNKSAEQTLAIKTPIVSFEPPVYFEGDELVVPKAPPILMFSRLPKQHTATESRCTSANAETESSCTSANTEAAPNHKSAAYHLLQEIRSKIETLDDGYLNPGNPALAGDIEKIKNLLKLKNKSFRKIAPDFIKLISELRPVALTEDNLAPPQLTQYAKIQETNQKQQKPHASIYSPNVDILFNNRYLQSIVLK